MGSIHALHIHELARATGDCTFPALCSGDLDKAERFASEMDLEVPIFPFRRGACRGRRFRRDGDRDCHPPHRRHATALIAKGLRVLLEQAMTEVFETDLEFATELDGAHPHAVMLAFQRRFDQPLLHARELVSRGVIGRIFKVYSAMEDSNPAVVRNNSGRRDS